MQQTPLKTKTHSDRNSQDKGKVKAGKMTLLSSIFYLLFSSLLHLVQHRFSYSYFNGDSYSFLSKIRKMMII